MTTVQLVTATAMALLVFTALANLVVDLYARGAVRAAVDEGARNGARAGGGVTACERRASEVLDGLVGGRIRPRTRVTCSKVGGFVVAHGTATLPGWLPGLVPTWSVEVTARATDEDPR